MPVRPAVYPCLVYADAPAAIDFICAAFGFERMAVHADGETIHNAQLTFHDQLVMLSSAQRDGRDRFGMVPIGELKGQSAICICVTCEDPDAHFSVAANVGANIISAPHDNDYGGRSYECRDPEGVVWSFANYDPWAGAV